MKSFFQVFGHCWRHWARWKIPATICCLVTNKFCIDIFLPFWNWSAVCRTGEVFSGVMRVNDYVFICTWHKVSSNQGTISAASPRAWLIRERFFKKMGISSLKMRVVKGNEWALLHSRQMGILSHTHQEVNCVKWNILQNATATTHHAVQNFSGWNPSGFVEDNPEMRCGTWLSWATVVGPVADRKPNTTPPVCCWYRI